jgi:hypothetical protein
MKRLIDPVTLGLALVPTRTITAGGVDFAYRAPGKHHGDTPVVFMTHLAADLDSQDPRVNDGIAAQHHVMARQAETGLAKESRGLRMQPTPPLPPKNAQLHLLHRG